MKFQYMIFVLQMHDVLLCNQPGVLCYIVLQIHSLFLCQCKICIDCLTQYLELYVREKLIKEFVCPVCDEPDTENIDLAETHFEFLDMMVKFKQIPFLSMIRQCVLCSFCAHAHV